MRNALTIAGKELSSYFVQPVAYVVLTVFVLLAGWFFFALLKQFSEMVQVYSAMSNAQALEHLNLNARVIEPLLHNMSVVMVILVPAITMRAFAEEKRTGSLSPSAKLSPEDDPGAAPLLDPAAPLVIRLFGPLEVLVHGQLLARLRSRKSQWLLALLILRHGSNLERS